MPKDAIKLHKTAVIKDHRFNEVCGAEGVDIKTRVFGINILGNIQIGKVNA